MQSVIQGKPFLKWAGGKGQLLSTINQVLPLDFLNGSIKTYIEPFIGSGAVLFMMLGKFPSIKTAIINDINPDLTTAYNTIKASPQKLIKSLYKIQEEFYTFTNEEDRKKFYLDKRAEFNQRNNNEITNTSLLIFLNRTCFNGLYRVNSKGLFNVPFGKYTNPKICDERNILAVSDTLKKVTIINGDFFGTLEYADKYSFVYLDPPYKPISKTSSFNAYASESFDDAQQIRLAEFCGELDKIKSKWLLSNSDPNNYESDNTFFDKLYHSYTINKVLAKRNINSKGEKRGHISELLINNFEGTI